MGLYQWLGLTCFISTSFRCKFIPKLGKSIVELQQFEVTVLHVLMQGTASIENNMALQVFKTMSAVWIGAYACIHQDYIGCDWYDDICVSVTLCQAVFQ